MTTQKRDAVSQAEFARLHGWQRSYVTQLKASGRLVVKGNFVDVAASLALIASTADHGHSDVAQRRAAARKIDKKRGGGPGHICSADGEKAAASFSRSRALKEHYLALRAKGEYERDILGRLCKTDEVMCAGAGLLAVVRSKLSICAARLAPAIAAVSDIESVHALLVEHTESVLHEIATELVRLSGCEPGTQQPEGLYPSSKTVRHNHARA